MFANETARETVVLHLINIHMSVQVHYTIWVSALRPRKTFKVIQGGCLILATLFLHKPSEYEHFCVPKKEILT